MWDVMRRNKRIFLVVTVIAVWIYIYLSYRAAKVPPRPVRKIKGRHSVQDYAKNLTSSQTFRQKFTDHTFLHPNSKTSIDMYLRGKWPNYKFRDSVLRTKSDFNIEEDVIVYMHIQKVGGTSFNEHLLKDLVLDHPCECLGNPITRPCNCLTKGGNLWLFSWLTVGWPCGLHADWTMLQECVDSAVNEIEGKKRKRRYFYITLLRDPVKRYLSEWSHLRKGQHWKDAKLRCNGERVTNFDVFPCFNEPTWEGVTFNEFMDCRDNLATNRQTRMLADLTKAECYHRNRIKPDVRSRIILESAIDNIQAMSFFGITEKQSDTRRLFEEIFNLKFRNDFRFEEEAETEDDFISSSQYAEMMAYIELDVQLYLFAVDLFEQRVNAIR